MQSPKSAFVVIILFSRIYERCMCPVRLDPVCVCVVFRLCSLYNYYLRRLKSFYNLVCSKGNLYLQSQSNTRHTYAHTPSRRHDQQAKCKFRSPLFAFFAFHLPHSSPRLSSVRGSFTRGQCVAGSPERTGPREHQNEHRHGPRRFIGH